MLCNAVLKYELHLTAELLSLFRIHSIAMFDWGRVPNINVMLEYML